MTQILLTLFLLFSSTAIHAQSCTFIDNEDTKRLCKAMKDEGSCTYINNEDKKRLCKAIKS